jgi:hypothetical protein
MNAFKRFAFIFSTIAISATSVYAQEADITSYENNVIDSLHYRNAAKTFYTSLNLTTPIVRTEDIWTNGGKTHHFSRTSLTTTLEFSYGITDALLVGFAENYLISSNSTNNNIANGTFNTSSSTGISDPTFDISYRYLGTLTGKKFGTVYLDLTPALGKQQNPGTTSNGNNYAANSTIAVGTNLYWVAGVHEFSINPYLTYRTSGTFNRQSGASFTNNAYAFYGAAGSYRYHISERFYFSTNLNIMAPYSEIFNNPANTESDSFQYQVAETVTFGWKPAESWLFTAALSNTSSSDSITFNNGATNEFDTFQTNNFTVTAVHIY